MDGSRRRRQNERGRQGRWVSSTPRAERARQLADVLRQQITSGAFAGGAVPEERILVQTLGASRNAVREALGLLREEGLIQRRRGVGTTVVTPKYGHGLDRLAGLAEALTGYGTVTNEVRSACAAARPPAAIAHRLDLPEGTDAVYVERLRRLGGQPLSVDTSWLVAEIGRPVLGGDLAHRDVFDLIEETTGQRLGEAEVTVHAITADADTAALLEIVPGAAIFAIDRLTRLADGRAVDAESLRIRADRLALRAVLHRGAVPSG